MDDSLVVLTRQCLARLTVRAWRVSLDTHAPDVHTPLLRGVWGKALHNLDRDLYRVLFEGAGGVPGYLIRPALVAEVTAPVFDFLLFGPADPEVEARVWTAWEEALQRGLGQERCPARLLDVRPINWDGLLLASARRQPGFALAPLSWPAGELACRLLFPAPLRLLRDGRLLTSPTLADIAVAALRRFHSLAPEAAEPVWQRRHEWIDRSWTVTAAPFQGGPLDLIRYSGRQRTEIELRGVAGEIFLPEGPGPLADLLLAATWLHLGKNAVMGMGRMGIEPLPARPGR